MDCIFCKIIQGEIASYKVYEDDKVLAFLDIQPVNPGHILVVPKEHYENLISTPDELAGRLIIVAKEIAKAMQAALAAPGVNFGINNGTAAGQVVAHTHIHIIPRFKNDTLRLWPNKKYQDEQIPKRLAEKIRAKL